MTYLHKHHIVPRSRGGSNEPWNIIELSDYDHAYEHALDFVLFDHAPRFDCRHICWKVLPEELKVLVKNKLSRITSEKNLNRIHSHETKIKLSRARKGRTLNDEWKRKLSRSLKGRPKSAEHKQKIGLAHRGKQCSERELQRLRTINLGRKWYNNGQRSTLTHECPPGYVPGRLKRGPMPSA